MESDSFYPFGQPRNQFQPRSVNENYKFTQKEQDQESGLQYFESRFYAGHLARFSRVDSLADNLKAEWFQNPQGMNLYSYCANRPIVYSDPTGMAEIRDIPIACTTSVDPTRFDTARDDKNCISVSQVNQSSETASGSSGYKGEYSTPTSKKSQINVPLDNPTKALPTKSGLSSLVDDWKMGANQMVNGASSGLKGASSSLSGALKGGVDWLKGAPAGIWKDAKGAWGGFFNGGTSDSTPASKKNAPQGPEKPKPDPTPPATKDLSTGGV